MPSSSPTPDGVRQKSISQGMPPGDPAQRATFNNGPLGQVPLGQNALLATAQGAQAPQGGPMQGGPVMGPAPGRQMADAIGQHIASLPPARAAQASGRIGYMVNLLGSLARKPDLRLSDVISAAGQSVADGQTTPEEASAEIAGLPENPARLKAVIQQRYKAEIIAAALLSGPQQQGPSQGSVPAQIAPQSSPQTPPAPSAPSASNMLTGGTP